MVGAVIVGFVSSYWLLSGEGRTLENDARPTDTPHSDRSFYLLIFSTVSINELILTSSLRMTILLLGVGADGQNSNPIAPVHEDGRFEYIPIPETVENTSETRTYGTEQFRFQPGVQLSEYLNWIKPGGDDTRKKETSDAIANHPLHYDPDFDNLTYGESGARSEYVNRLLDLEPGEDAVAFYAGLARNGRKHRYLIGYFVVNEVVHLKNESDLERERIFEDHPHNAHSKRYFGNGESKHKELVLVDGKEPGRLLERAKVKMSSYDPFGAHQYYLADDFVREFPLDDRSYVHDPDSQKKEDKVWIGFKKPLELGLSVEEFERRIRALEAV